MSRRPRPGLIRAAIADGLGVAALFIIVFAVLGGPN